MKKFFQQKSHLIVIVFNLILGLIWINTYYIGTAMQDFEALPHPDPMSDAVNILLWTYLLSLGGLLVARRASIKWVFVFLCFLIVPLDAYSSLCLVIHTFPANSELSGWHVFYNATLISGAFPITPAKEAYFSFHGVSIWWYLTEGARCFLWAAFNFWYYLLRNAVRHNKQS